MNLLKLGENKVPSGRWAAVKDGIVIAWADTLERLRRVMERKGFRRDEYYVVKVSGDDLMVV